MNKEILRNAGLADANLADEKPTDLLIMADVANEESGQALVARMDEFLSEQVSISSRSRLHWELRGA